MARYLPKTLAKTLTYIAYHAPGEYGLFWDQDGTMPWKELYWALQEDPELRFVRQNHLRELTLLALEMPIELDGNLLRIRKGRPVPDYPSSEQPPARLFYACPRKRYGFVLENGLAASGRRFLALASDQHLALRIGNRRDPEPFMIEVNTRLAASDGICFRVAGPELFLVESIGPKYLQFPRLREDDWPQLTARRKEQPTAKTLAERPAPGSFVVSPEHLQQAVNGKPGIGDTGKTGKGRRGPGWKREARKARERHKRSI